VATLSLAVETDDARQEVSQTVENQDGNPALTSLVVVEVEGGRYMAESSVSGNITGAGTVEGLSGTFMQVDTPFSFGAVGDMDWRSKQIYTMELLPAGAAKPMVLELSQGPAFGEAVLLSVRRGVWLAGALAVVLATAVGAMSSRRFSRPIARLAGVTAAMTAGDLTARAPVRGEDEIGQLSRSFNEMAARIEQTVETLRKFIADAAHELNTPLTALRTNLELVLAKSSTTKDSPLHAAHEQALRLQRLNDDLLRLSHLESGLAQEQYSPVDLGDLVAAHSERFAAEAEQKGVAFTVVLPRESVRLWGQRQNLGRLVENLLDNALKFTAEGAITVQVEAEGEWAKLSIADTGMGLMAETGQLFGRFYRGENALTYPGSGLGLAIVQTIATTHRGRVTATARAQGSEFCVCLPLNRG
jgi:signal transduction histidine kinase